MADASQPQSSLTLLVTLEVRPDALAEFRAYEMRAATIMAKHGGRIVQTLVFDPSDTDPLVTEVHLVTFPNADAFASYRNDAELRALQPVRERVIARTSIRVGRTGPSYEPDATG